MPTLETVAAFLEDFAPARLAEQWDNVGLLVGDRTAAVSRIMTCLTITPDSAAEAIDGRADLIVTHHPLPFHPLRRLTSDTVEGRLLLNLIRAGVAIHSPHTAFDSTQGGINQRFAEGLGLAEITPLRDFPAGGGAGRCGKLPQPITLQEMCARVKHFLRIEQVQVVGDVKRALAKVAVACGSAGEFLGPARERSCDCLVTGETRFHTCLEAEATGIAIILTGHYASERFGIEALAEILAEQFPEITIWASRRERDPLRWE